MKKSTFSAASMVIGASSKGCWFFLAGTIVENVCSKGNAIGIFPIISFGLFSALSFILKAKLTDLLFNCFQNIFNNVATNHVCPSMQNIWYSFSFLHPFSLFLFVSKKIPTNYLRSTVWSFQLLYKFIHKVFVSRA